MGDCLAVCDETKQSADGAGPRKTAAGEREIETLAIIAGQRLCNKLLIP